MSPHPLVSVIINNYNYERFLAAAIDSALAQTYDRVEVIVVDDGSTDASRHIIAGYRERVHPILKPNGGQASAMNAGFVQSRGEIVIFLDSDDVLLPDMVSRMVEVFLIEPDVAKVQCRMEIIDVSGARTGIIQPAAHLPMPSGDLRRQVLTFPDDMTWMATSANAFSARVLHKMLPIPETDFPILADLYLCPVACLFGRAVSIPSIGAYYRIHGANNYADVGINLEKTRQTITFWDRAHRHIELVAAGLELSRQPCAGREVLSVAHLMHRAISLKLEPEKHPITGDSPGGLVRLGAVAALRRWDVSLMMKLIYILWFMAMASAPRRMAWWLAYHTLFPQRRGRINKVLEAVRKGWGVL